MSLRLRVHEEMRKFLKAMVVDNSGEIEVIIHHRGKLVNEGCLRYEGECESMHFDPDYWSYYVVVSAVKALGYLEFQDLWYSVGCGPVLDGKLEALCDDVGAMHMVNLARLNGRVHLYVVHCVSQGDVIQMIEYNVHEEQLDEGVQHEGGESAKLDVDRIEVEVDGEEVEVVVGEGEGIEHDEVVNERIEVVVDGEEEQVDVREVEGIQHDEAVNERIEVHVDGEEVEVVVGEGEGIEHDEAINERIEVVVDGEEEPVDVREVEGIEVDVHVEEVEVDVGESGGIQNEEGHDEETVEVNTAVVNEWSSSDDDIGEVNIVDGEVNSVDGEVHSVDGLVDVNVHVISESDLEQHHESDLEEHEINDNSLFNDEWEYEELTSPYISDEESDVEEGYGNFDTFTMPKKMVDFKWEVGTFFGQKVDILDAIRTYSLENGKKLKFIKNDNRRIRIKCMGAKGECPWMAYFANMEAINTWQLRTLVDGHTCSREHKLGVFNAR
ncbi:hypothetical protein V8G54_019362 [Vigna mungo]|uniref:Transposase MuDR plant domain-containing protein n=1 Tax=Vigna mungo TaxID=3915 RepID=A0AAQ3RVL3_VIGMU